MDSEGVHQLRRPRSSQSQNGRPPVFEGKNSTVIVSAPGLGARFRVSMGVPRRRRLAQERVPGLSKGETYGDLLTAEVVRLYIRPATAQVKTCYAEALVTGQVPPKHLFPWCTSATVVDLDGVSQQVCACSTLFGGSRRGGAGLGAGESGAGDAALDRVVLALVGLLDQHYSSLSGSKCGARFLPVYYWLDIFAVTQHFEGNFKDHPDADFRGVIRTAKSVLFTMIPWRAPVTPTRVWCLFEALAAIQTPGVGFDVLLDVKDSKDTRVKTITVISNSIDVRTAHATVMSDKTYILGCIEQGVGVGTFNNTIRKRLKEALLQAVTPNAVEMGDTAALHELLKIGGCVRPDGICEFSSMFRLASEGDILRILRSMQIRDLRPRGLVLTGRRQKEVMLSDAGLRDWDDEGLRLREYGEVETGRMLWNYLPAAPALCQSIAELLLMPPASSTNRGVEELWISLRAPRADEFAPPPAVLRQPSTGALISTSAAAAAAASLGIQGGGEEGDEDESSPPSPRAGPSGPSYGAPAPSLPPLRGPAVGSSPRMSGTGLPPAPQPGGGLGSYGSPRVSMTGLTGSLGGTAPVQPGLAALMFTERGGGGSAPSSGPTSQTGSPRALHPQPPSGHMVGASNPRERPELPLPPGRPALWAGVGGSPTLRTLCLYQSVLAPQDVAMLAAALRMNAGLVNLQFVRCSAPGPEGNTAVSTARLTGELLALGLSASHLRQLHVRPAGPLYLDSIPPCCPPRDSLLRRVSLTPVALSPAAIRQLGRLLAPLPELESLTVGLDPAPYTTFMPRDPSEWDQWLWFEDRNDPEMASRRRRYMGLDDEGQAYYVANAIDLKDELLALPRAGSSHGGDAAPNGGAGGLGRGAALAPMDQRAAGISMCLALLCGWRDFKAYRQQYGRWEWARRVSLEDSLAEMTRNFESMAVIVIESLQATPPAYSARFDAACRHSLSNLKPTRLQEIYWELYA
eukprot:XP_001695428.1 predicted protein [Chlamydomonas reinhardtii]